MTVEVKQLIIKSTMISGPAEQEDTDGKKIVDIEQLKEIVRDECRDLIAESVSEWQER